LGRIASPVAAPYVVIHPQPSHNPINLVFLFDPLLKSEFLPFSQMNREDENINQSGQFMTLFYMLVDQDSRCPEWVRAGHEPGIFYDPERGLFEDLAGPGLVLIVVKIGKA
jgi:hypothetical protein